MANIETSKTKLAYQQEDQKERQRQYENFKANTANGRYGKETFQPIGKYILPAIDKTGKEVGAHVIPPYSCVEGKKSLELTKSTVAYVSDVADALLQKENFPKTVSFYLKRVVNKFEFTSLFAAGYRPDVDALIKDIKSAQGNPRKQADVLNDFQLCIALNSYTGAAALAASLMTKNLNPQSFKKFEPLLYDTAVANYQAAKEIYKNKDNLYFNENSPLLSDIRDTIANATREDSYEFANTLIDSINMIPNNEFSNITDDPELASASVKSLNKIANAMDCDEPEM